MYAKTLAVKQRIISEIEDTLANEPELIIERDGHKWVALRVCYWLHVLGSAVSERTFRTIVGKPPFVKRTFVITSEDGYHLDHEYERVLCLRLGDESNSTLDRAKQLSSIYHGSVPKKPEGWSTPGYDAYQACVEPTKTGWKAPGRRELFPAFMKLADLWGEDAPRMFQHIVTHWPDFIAMCDGVDQKMNFPSVRTILKHEATARKLWAYNLKAKANVGKLARLKKAA